LRFRDGPLSRRPPEEIRYGIGKTALGALLVAVSDDGIVAIVIRDKVSQLLSSLRFPKAKLIRDPRCVSEVAAYIAAPFKPFPLALDLRGTDFQRRVWEEVRRIPIGENSSYTKIAEAIGAPKAIRAVASSCSRCMHAFAVPCHRVLHKGGDARDARGMTTGGKRRLRWVDYEARLLAASRTPSRKRRPSASRVRRRSADRS
jgi:AraC family transcriptional regulator of adaptative response/methylated-DNA-[protein]-cysteine methyltransferase